MDFIYILSNDVEMIEMLILRCKIKNFILSKLVKICIFMNCLLFGKLMSKLFFIFDFL